MNDTHVFTLIEANGLIPELTRRLTGLLEKKEECTRRHDELLMHELLTEAESAHAEEDRAANLEEQIHGMEAAILDLENDLKAIRALGCVLRNLERGFIDFLAEREGERIYYCWKLGEDSVHYYHALKDGMKRRLAIF